MSIPIYNFKKIEDLLNDKNHNLNNYSRTNSQSSFFMKKNMSYNNLNSNSSFRFNNSLKRSRSKSSYFSMKNNSTMKDYNYNIKSMENLINVIKENAYVKNKNDIIIKTNKKNELKNNINILENLKKLNRISKTNFRNLSKGIIKENERLNYFSQRANQESYYFNLLIPNLKKEIYNMKKEIEYKHEESKNLNNKKTLIEKEIMEINDEIKKYNRLNNELFNKKEKIKLTLDLFKNHIKIQKEKLDIQNLKIKELMESLSFLAKKSLIENQY